MPEPLFTFLTYIFSSTIPGMEKRHIHLDVSSTVSAAGQDEAAPQQPTNITLRALNWHPGYRRQFPWKGFVGFIGVLTCALINIAILTASDGVSSSKWPNEIAPHTIIGTVMVVSGLSLALAIGEGISIAWWRKGLC
jgi:hypothetical protein